MNNTKTKLTFKFDKRKMKGWLGGFLCALPVILGVLIFTYYPAFTSLIYSFYDYDGFYKMDPVGFDNFKMMFMYDPDTWKVFGNTFLFAIISVPLNLFLGYFLALAANSKVKGIGVFRVFFYLPVIIPSVASGILFADLFSGGTDGIFNRILTGLGIPQQPFFGSSDTAMATMIVMGLWSLGGGMVIWLSSFKNIDASLYESAKLDGASAFQRLIHITLPMSSSVIFYNLVTGVIGALQTTTTLFVGGRTGTGIGNSLYFVTIKIYNSFMGGQYGYACAFAWVLFIVIALLTGLIFKTSKWVYYGEEN